MHASGHYRYYQLTSQVCGFVVAAPTRLAREQRRKAERKCDMRKFRNYWKMREIQQHPSFRRRCQHMPILWVAENAARVGLWFQVSSTSRGSSRSTPGSQRAAPSPGSPTDASTPPHRLAPPRIGAVRWSPNSRSVSVEASCLLSEGSLTSYLFLLPFCLFLSHASLVSPELHSGPLNRSEDIVEAFTRYSICAPCYQGMTPSSLKNPPLGPSAGRVAKATGALAPCSGVIYPR